MDQGITAFNPPSSIVAQTRQQMNQNAPVLNQVSQDSPLFQPSMQAPQQSPMPNKTPMQNFAQGLAKPPTMSQKPLQGQLHSRADTIVKALTSHLAQLDKLMATPQQPQG